MREESARRIQILDAVIGRAPYAAWYVRRVADLVAEFLSVAAQLTGAHVEFALCGGMALAVHGHVRATRDIDLLVPRAQLDDALKALREVGFDLPAHPMTFGAGTAIERHVQRVSKSVDRELVTIDLILVEPSFGEVWAQRQVFEREGVAMPVVSRLGLVTMKRAAGRPQDLADIQALEDGDG